MENQSQKLRILLNSKATIPIAIRDWNFDFDEINTYCTSIVFF